MSAGDPGPDGVDFRALYERAPFGYLSLSPAGTIVSANATFLALTGYAAADLVGRRSFADLLTGGGRIYHETHYRPTLEMQGFAREIAFDVVCADGRRMPALVNSVLERDATGRPVRILAAVFDATERRQYERELLAAKERAEALEAHARVLSRTLQQTLLPPAVPTVAGLDLGAAYRPAGSGEEIGGDFYDVFRLGPSDWMVSLGDIQGKGVEAAVVTALARYTVRTAAVEHDRPSDVLRTLNDVLRLHESERLCTAVVLRLRREGAAWRTTLALGGHPPPLLVREGGTVEEIGRGGPLLGFFPEATFADTELVLHPGDRLVTYSDGVSEARIGGAFLDPAEVSAVAASPWESAAEAAARLLAVVLDFQRGQPRDDIAIVTLRAT